MAVMAAFDMTSPNMELERDTQQRAFIEYVRHRDTADADSRKGMRNNKMSYDD